MRRKLFFIAVSMMAGIVTAYCFGAEVGFGAGGILFLVCLKKGREKQLLIVLSVAFLTGCLLLFFTQLKVTADKISAYPEAAARIEGEVLQIDRLKEDKYKICCSVNGEKVLCTYYQPLDKYWELVGRRICFNAEIETPAEPGNPRTFDYSLYLKSKDIYHTAVIGNFSLIDTESSFVDCMKRQVLRSREKLMAELKVSPKVKGLIRGVLFGDIKSLDEEVYEEFRQNGTAHVLAVSGLHVGILYGIYRRLSKKRKGHFLTALFILFLLIYGTATLWAVSVTRAVMLILLMLLGDILHRRYDMLTGLSAIAILLMIKNPYVIFGASFQMSFLAVLSMVFLMPVLTDKIGQSFALLISVQLGLMPYMAYTFNYISFTGILCNIPIVFLVGILVPIGITGYLVYFFTGISCPMLSEVLNGLGYMIIRLNHFFQADGILSFDVASPPFWLLVLFYGFLFFFFSEYFQIFLQRRTYRLFLLPVLAIFIAAAGAGYFWQTPFDEAGIVFVDVGQGDCVHLKGENGTNLLIDGGGNKNYNVGEKVLKPYLLKNGITKIDLAAVTHLHTDHFLGVSQLAECFSVEKILTEGKAGDKISLGDDQWIDIIWPVGQNDDTEDENLNSLIFKIYDHGITVLITGDITAEGERLLLEQYKGTEVLQADVLKVAHHGSAYSSCEEFLEVVNPAAAVISVGKNNYGHPDNMLIEKMQKKGIMVFRTDKNGAVGIINRRGQLRICTKKQ